MLDVHLRAASQLALFIYIFKPLIFTIEFVFLLYEPISQFSSKIFFYQYAAKFPSKLDIDKVKEKISLIT